MEGAAARAGHAVLGIAQLPPAGTDTLPFPDVFDFVAVDAETIGQEGPGVGELNT